MCNRIKFVLAWVPQGICQKHLWKESFSWDVAVKHITQGLQGKQVDLRIWFMAIIMVDQIQFSRLITNLKDGEIV